MTHLEAISKRLFSHLRSVVSFLDKPLQRQGLQGVKTELIHGAQGWEFVRRAEGESLRCWLSEKGPGCTVQGDPVIGYVWTRLSMDPADRCIGILINHGDGGVGWLAQAKGDLPTAGILDLRAAAIRSGPDRLVELTTDLLTAASASWAGRYLDQHTGGERT